VGLRALPGVGQGAHAAAVSELPPADAEGDVGVQMSRVTEAAMRFHHGNPHVFRKLVEIALEVKRSGKRHFGIAALFERLRWISQFQTEDDKYKLNNSYRAYYARQLMEQVPELREFFKTRDSAFDPDYHARLPRHRRGKKPTKPSVVVTPGRLF
jgi:hypothetical protein